MTDCFRCKGTTKPQTKTHTVTLNDCVIIIKNVPALVCKQCGEAYFTDEVIENLEITIDSLEGVIKEVAIVEYTTANVA